MSSKNKPSPKSATELLQLTENIAGLCLGELAHRFNWPIPDNLKHNKGWVGQFLEFLLGTTAGNLSEPDFQELGIELKTIPLNSNHKARETTYVCVVPLLNHSGLQWQDSCVYKKLKKVLWVPIEANPDLALADRKVGQAFLWSPSEDEMDALQTDWEEFMELISLGQVESITAHQGEFLQIRPKAANASVITTGIGENGLKKQTLPRGFYLRTLFTNKILKSRFK